MRENKIHFPLKYEPRKEQIDMLNFTADSINHSKKFILINAPTGVGKAQPLLSLVLTNNGWIEIGKLKLNDKVITPNGELSKIIQLHPINILDIYEIEFSDGRKIECTENHLWKIHSHDWVSKWKILETKEIIKKIKEGRKDNKLYIPLVNIKEKKDINLPIDPYLMGCLLVNDELTQNISFIKNNFIINKLKPIFEKYDSELKIRKSGLHNNLKSILEKLNLQGLKSELKFIPEIYKKSSYNQKIKLIQGFLDIDGYVSKNGSVQFSSYSLKLIKDLQEIIWSIGGIAKIKEKIENYNYKNKEHIKKHYNLYIRYKSPKELVSLPIKLERISENYQYSDLKLKIINIKKIRQDLTRCITIDSKEQLYITDNYIITHNSYYSTMLINWYLINIEEDAKFDIITNSKVLQEQYIKDFNFICNLKGRVNYKCEQFDTDCEKGIELCSALKKQCDNCPYINQRNAWLMSKIGLSNFHLFNTFLIYNPTIIEKKDKPARVLIIDEAHDFEAVFSDFMTVKLSGKTLKKYGFSSKEIMDIDNRIAKLKTLEQSLYFLKLFFIDEITKRYIDFEKEIKTGTSLKRSTELTRYMTYIMGQNERFKTFINDYESEYKEGGIDPKENWVIDIVKNSKNTFGTGIEITISPVWVHKYLPQYIWNKFDHIIFMSGTILNKKMFSFINGLNPKLTSFMDMNSPFSLKKRPVYYLKCGKMTYKEKENTFKNQEKFIRKIIDKYKKDKGIIHTTTYEFSKWIEDSIFNDRFLFHDNTNREEKLEEHINSFKPSILISPSMHTGVDLKDDLSRFQIILKIPYPNISSNKIKQRQKTKPEWYNWKTMVDFIQALGRSVRSVNDYADTYVLDSSLSSLLMYNGNFIPRYITNAIKEIKINK